MNREHKLFLERAGISVPASHDLSEISINKPRKIWDLAKGVPDFNPEDIRVGDEIIIGGGFSKSESLIVNQIVNHAVWGYRFIGDTGLLHADDLKVINNSNLLNEIKVNQPAYSVYNDNPIKPFNDGAKRIETIFNAVKANPGLTFKRLHEDIFYQMAYQNLGGYLDKLLSAKRIQFRKVINPNTKREVAVYSTLSSSIDEIKINDPGRPIVYKALDGDLFVKLKNKRTYWGIEDKDKIYFYHVPNRNNDFNEVADYLRLNPLFDATDTQYLEIPKNSVEIKDPLDEITVNKPSKPIVIINSSGPYIKLNGRIISGWSGEDGRNVEYYVFEGESSLDDVDSYFKNKGTIWYDENQYSIEKDECNTIISEISIQKPNSNLPDGLKEYIKSHTEEVDKIKYAGFKTLDDVENTFHKILEDFADPDDLKQYPYDAATANHQYYGDDRDPVAKAAAKADNIFKLKYDIDYWEARNFFVGLEKFYKKKELDEISINNPNKPLVRISPTTQEPYIEIDGEKIWGNISHTNRALMFRDNDKIKNYFKNSKLTSDGMNIYFSFDDVNIVDNLDEISINQPLKPFTLKVLRKNQDEKGNTYQGELLFNGRSLGNTWTMYERGDEDDGIDVDYSYIKNSSSMERYIKYPSFNNERDPNGAVVIDSKYVNVEG